MVHRGGPRRQIFVSQHQRALQQSPQACKSGYRVSVEACQCVLVARRPARPSMPALPVQAGSARRPREQRSWGRQDQVKGGVGDSDRGWARRRLATVPMGATQCEKYSSKGLRLSLPRVGQVLRAGGLLCLCGGGGETSMLCTPKCFSAHHRSNSQVLATI